MTSSRIFVCIAIIAADVFGVVLSAPASCPDGKHAPSGSSGPAVMCVGCTAEDHVYNASAHSALAINAETLELDVRDDHAWEGGVDVDGVVYMVPAEAASVLRIDTNNGDAMKSIQIEASLTGGVSWRGGVMAPNGAIYCVPYQRKEGTQAVLKIDPRAQRATLLEVKDDALEKNQFYGAVLADDGSIVGVPAARRHVLKIFAVGSEERVALEDPGISWDSGDEKNNAFRGGVLTATGTIVCIPYHSKDVLAINDRLLGVQASIIARRNDQNRFWGGVLAANGHVYAVPHTVSGPLKIDVAKRQMTILATPGRTATRAHAGGVMAPSGIIYGLPYNMPWILRIDPMVDSVETFVLDTTAHRAAGWTGGVLARSGIVYAAPFDARFVLKVGMVACSFSCRPGRFQSPGPGHPVCLVCPAGKFQNQRAQAACTNCGAGRYSDADASIACKTCGRGKYAAQPALASCTACAAGRFQNQKGQDVCNSCEAGRYNDEPGRADEEDLYLCKGCVAGRYNNQLAQTEASACKRCVTAKYAVAASANCTRCDVGSHAPDEASPLLGTSYASTCVACAVGKHGADTYRAWTGMNAYGGHGATDIDRWAVLGLTLIECQARCNADSACDCIVYVPTFQRSQCWKRANCVTSSFVDSAAHSVYVRYPVCQNCTAGWYGAQTRQIACSRCAPGAFNNQLAQPACKDCGAGMYSDLTGNIDCKMCAAGRYGDQGGQNVCKACPVGMHQRLAGRNTWCEGCGPGMYNDQTGQTACKDCAAGMYNDEPAWSTPLTPGSPSWSRPTKTPPEQQKDCWSLANSTTIPDSWCMINCNAHPVNCPLGVCKCAAPTPAPTPSPTPGPALACKVCPAGSRVSIARDACDMLAAPTAVPTPVPSASPTPNAATSCAAGRFGTSCEACAEGQYQDAPEQAACKDCAVGRYADQAGQQACKLCEPGRFSSTQQSGSVCVLCRQGYFQSRRGQESCKLCPRGKVTKTDGATASFECSCDGEACCGPGTFLNATLRECSNCPLGRFQLAAGKNECDVCPPGKYSATEGQMFCENCPFGHRGATVTGGSRTVGDCEPCPAGQYQAAVAQSTCRACKAGAQQSATGQASCNGCQPGRWSSAGAVGCIMCAAGRFGDMKKADDRGLQGHCTNCPDGMYQESEGRAFCVACAAGKSGDAARPKTSEDKQCIVCAAGTFQAGVGTGSCVTCDAGRYQETPGQLACKECPPGRYSLARASHCKECDRGRFGDEQAPRGSPAHCAECPKGQFQDRRSRTFCIVHTNCTLGQMIVAGASTTANRRCAQCPPGRYQDEANAQGCKACGECATGGRDKCGGAFEGVCAVCVPGRFASVSSSRCEACPAGKYTDRTDETACKICDRGYHCVGGHRTYCNTAGQYCPTVGLIAMQVCPPGMACSAEAEERPCGEGEVSQKGKCTRCADGDFVPPGRNLCEPCPELDGAVTCLEAKPGIADNHFCAACVDIPVALQEVPQLLPCPVPGACLTTINSTDATVRTACAKGRAGALCAACEPGYGAAGPVCAACPPTGSIEVAIVFGLLVFLAMFARVVRLALRHGLRGHKSPHVTMTAIKILLVFLFSTSLLSSYQLDWGTALLTAFGISGGAAAGDVSSVALTGCIGFTLHAKMRFVLVAPFMAALLPLPVLAANRLRGDAGGTVCGAAPPVAYKTAVLIALWMLHPMVLRECVLALLTTRVGDAEYVAADMNIATGDPEYASTRAIAIMLLVTFVPALPCYVFGTMHHHRDHLRTRRGRSGAPEWLRQRYFFWYGSYRPRFYMWEATNFTMKTFLTLISCYASIEPDPSVLIFLATWVVLLAALVEIKFEAYSRAIEETLVKTSLFVLLALMLCALGLVAGRNDPDFQAVLRALAGMAVLGTMLLFGALFVQQCAAKKGAEIEARRASPAVGAGRAGGFRLSSRFFFGSTTKLGGSSSVSGTGGQTPGLAQSTDKPLPSGSAGGLGGDFFTMDNPLARSAQGRGGGKGKSRGSMFSVNNPLVERQLDGQKQEQTQVLAASEGALPEKRDGGAANCVGDIDKRRVSVLPAPATSL